MKLIKLEKTDRERILRITYKNWWGKTFTKDIMRSSFDRYYHFVDTGSPVNHRSEVFEDFRNSELKIYKINGKTYK